MRWLDGITDSMDMNLGKLRKMVRTGSLECCSPWDHKESDTTELLHPPDLDAGKDGMKKEKRVAEDDMVGWHHRFNGHELGRTPGDGEGQGGLV